MEQQIEVCDHVISLIEILTHVHFHPKATCGVWDDGEIFMLPYLVEVTVS